MQFKTFNNLPNRLQTKIEAVRKESDEYAADELIELGEEILSQLAAIGLASSRSAKPLPTHAASAILGG